MKAHWISDRRRHAALAILEHHRHDGSTTLDGFGWWSAPQTKGGELNMINPHVEGLGVDPE